jgi:hypothetical protein
MADPPDLGSPISIIRQGGFYENGKAYSFMKKWEVAIFFVMGGELVYQTHRHGESCK